MKKLLLIATMAATLSGLSAMGQGLFIFTGGPRGAYDDWSTGVPRLAATNNVAFLWANSAITPSVVTATGVSSTATNGTSVYSYAQAWTAILTDPNYTLAINTNGSVLASILCAANGGW